MAGGQWRGDRDSEDAGRHRAPIQGLFLHVGWGDGDKDMAKSVSYEVLSTSRGDNWIIQSVYKDREVALYEARTLLENRHLKAVKVIQETYDDEADRTIASTIFNEARGAAKGKPKPETQEGTKDAPAAPAVGRKKDGSDFIKYLIILVLSLGGIALVMLAGAAFLMGTFGGK